MAPSQNGSEPLLPPKLLNEGPEPISATSLGAIKALSILRIALGASVLIAPRWSSALFRLPIPAEMAVIARLFGGREVVLGELLLTAQDKNSPTGGRREMKRALWANIGADSLDVCSVIFAVATGTMGKVPGALFGGGAAVLIALAALSLKGF
ncbi:hypothetical protein K505DRAFT_320640 [Melanomma pulvis-pyrius CBS 109.77]|uniref:Uncharacterized protein n=1 Tax=Melanomma pulvis-pyrius CBS 109.77 TaxID=1314802 RepID=A0A6A6XUL1_9PLEO|nr:hypothetical protein K505DRAFT_320640 [Melanomma pulvis-pyrius CBS 109.77]